MTAITLEKEEKAVTIDITAYKDVWIFIEHEFGKVGSVSFELLGEGRKLADAIGCKLCGMLFGDKESADKFAKEAIAYGAEKVYVMESPLLKEYRTDPYAKAAIDLIRKYKPEIVLFGVTTQGRDFAGTVATTIEAGLTADCTGLDIGETRKVDSGLVCLVMVAGYHGLAVDPEQLKHTLALGPEGMGTMDILRAAKELGLKAKEAQVNYDRLNRLPMPALAPMQDGKFSVLAKMDGDRVLVFDPLDGKPKILSKDDFICKWQQRIILITYRKSVAPSEKPFGLTWFVPAIWKYRKHLSKILTASLILQIFGLVTPVFTQVIIDKVLVHKGVTTLDVLAIGLITVLLFEALLNILRTYLFTHTTNRIDISLGTKLFKHLFSLPLNYFEVRRVGDTVARVRELENIRHFLTGAPLTSILDDVYWSLFGRHVHS